MMMSLLRQLIEQQQLDRKRTREEDLPIEFLGGRGQPMRRRAYPGSRTDGIPAIGDSDPTADSLVAVGGAISNRKRALGAVDEPIDDDASVAAHARGHVENDDEEDMRESPTKQQRVPADVTTPPWRAATVAVAAAHTPKATRATAIPATRATARPATRGPTARPATTAKSGRVVVNINEIKTRKVAASCTKDAFKRKGWEIGLKVAQGKGIAARSDEAKAYTSEGYRLASEYLKMIGI